MNSLPMSSLSRGWLPCQGITWLYSLHSNYPQDIICHGISGLYGICLFVDEFNCMSSGLFVGLSIGLSLGLSVGLSIGLSVSLSICLSVV